MVQKDSSQRKSGIRYSYKALRAACVAGACGLVVVSACNNGRSAAFKKADSAAAAKPSSADAKKDSSVTPSVGGPLDTALYNKKLAQLANGDSSGRWPRKTVYPNPGAILPFKRIVAYYGNLYSKNMGILGEYPPDEMLSKLKVELKKWQEADTSTPVIPALHYIAVTAQGAPGKDGKYRLRMPFKQIDSILHIAARINALVFLDIQVGFSDVQAEVPQLEKYLKMPNVHLGIDPEFSMKTGKNPGRSSGTMNQPKANSVSNTWQNLAKPKNLPPKKSAEHLLPPRWTMTTNTSKSNPNF